MNSTTAVLGGIIAILLVGGGIYYFSSMANTAPGTSATSTPTTGVDVGGTAKVPGMPNAVTSSVTSPSDTAVVLSGTATPNGAFTKYWYEYGTTASLGNKTADQMLGSGFTPISTPLYITGLSKDTTYYFRLVAENQFGKGVGDQHSFVTTHNVPAPTGTIPSIQTLTTNGITRVAASAHGEVAPNGASTTVWFEYGTTPNLGNITAFSSVGSGNGKVPVSSDLSNLQPGTAYYFRMNAQNQFGTVNGSILSFKTDGPVAVSTKAPFATTRAASAISVTTATLHGTVTPNGEETTYWFEYSTNQLLSALVVTTKKSAGAGISPATVEVADDIASLKANTTYYFRLVAENTKGITRGDKKNFKTAK